MAFRNWKQELADQRPARPSSLPFFLWLVGGLLALAGAACIALWVWPGYMLPRPWRRPGPPPQSIALFFSSDIQGHIEPCGCTEQEWGGLARMSGFLKSIKEPATRLAFDVGRMAAGNLFWERLVWERCLQGLGHMEFTAANLGASEITLSAADIRRAADNSPVLLLSANVIDEATRQPIVQTHHQVLVDNLRVTVVGVVQAGPEDRLGAGVAIDDVHKSLGALLPGLRPAADVLILLAACDRNMMREIAEAHPEIDVILGGRVRHSSEQIEQVGTCRIAYHASKGQIIGRVDLQIREDGRPDAATSTMTLLDNNVPEDQAMTELVEQCNAELARRNREGGLEALGVVISPPQAGTNTHMGDKRCQHCHTEIYATWMKSDHSRAYKSLVDSRRESNPDCLRCHVLALGSADGFRGINLSPDLINVQCESCHGRAGDHVRAREDGLAKTFGRMQRVSQDSCQVCHEGIHSPKFSYDSYWERIKHGE